MKMFGNCSVEAGRVSLRVKGGKATYNMYGYAIREDREGMETIVLQPADCRCKPVMEIPVQYVESLTIDL